MKEQMKEYFDVEINYLAPIRLCFTLCEDQAKLMLDGSLDENSEKHIREKLKSNLGNISRQVEGITGLCPSWLEDFPLVIESGYIDPYEIPVFVSLISFEHVWPGCVRVTGFCSDFLGGEDG